MEAGTIYRAKQSGVYRSYRPIGPSRYSGGGAENQSAAALGLRRGIWRLGDPGLRGSDDHAVALSTPIPTSFPGRSMTARSSAPIWEHADPRRNAWR